MLTALRTLRATLLCLSLAACSALGLGVVPIGDIVANPGRFDEAEVRVRGKVVDVNKLPLLGTRFYTLRDDTGEIAVTAADGQDLPAAGDVVVVRATVRTAAILQGQALGLRLVEIEKSSPLFR